MVGHQEILAEEEVELAGGEHPVFAAVIDCVNDDEEVGSEFILFAGRILIDFGQGAGGDTILYGKGVEVKDTFEDGFSLLRARALEVHPKEQVGIGEQRRHQEPVDVPGMQAALGRECERMNHRALEL